MFTTDDGWLVVEPDDKGNIRELTQGYDKDWLAAYQTIKYVMCHKCPVAISALWLWYDHTVLQSCPAGCDWDPPDSLLEIVEFMNGMLRLDGRSGT